jgi:hypothetical protein
MKLHGNREVMSMPLAGHPGSPLGHAFSRRCHRVRAETRFGSKGEVGAVYLIGRPTVGATA